MGRTGQSKSSEAQPSSVVFADEQTLLQRSCSYYIPSNQSVMSKDEVISYASLVAIMRSTWWPSGALSDMNSFDLEVRLYTVTYE